MTRKPRHLRVLNLTLHTSDISNSMKPFRSLDAEPTSSWPTECCIFVHFKCHFVSFCATWQPPLLAALPYHLATRYQPYLGVASSGRILCPRRCRSTTGSATRRHQLHTSCSQRLKGNQNHDEGQRRMKDEGYRFSICSKMCLLQAGLGPQVTRDPGPGCGNLNLCILISAVSA